MKFSSFIVEMDNMPPSEPQEVDKPVPDDKPKIITPNKKLILPAQPKREEPKGFRPEGPKKVDTFPNAVRQPYYTEPLHHEDEDYMNHMKERGETPSANNYLKYENYETGSDMMKSDRMRQYQRSMVKELYDYNSENYKYVDDYDDDDEDGERHRENFMKEWDEETEGMDLREMLNHDDFVYKHWVMGHELSDYLRNGDSHWRRNDKKDYGFYWRVVADILSDASYGAPSQLWRGLSDDVFKDLKIGDIVSDPGFHSTADDPTGTAYQFGPMNGGILMHINNEEANGYAIDMDAWGDNDQDEHVLLPGTALQFVRKEDDQNYHFNLLQPNFDEIDKYGKVKDDDGYTRKEMGFMESRQPLKLLNKMKDKMKEAFQQRMNDFHFEVLTPEEPEEEREPKKFDDFTAQFDHDD